MRVVDAVQLHVGCTSVPALCHSSQVLRSCFCYVAQRHRWSCSSSDAPSSTLGSWLIYIRHCSELTTFPRQTRHTVKRNVLTGGLVWLALPNYHHFNLLHFGNQRSKNTTWQLECQLPTFPLRRPTTCTSCLGNLLQCSFTQQLMEVKWADVLSWIAYWNSTHIKVKVECLLTLHPHKDQKGTACWS